MAKVFELLDDPVPYYSVYFYLTVIYLLHKYVKDRPLLVDKGVLKKLLAAHNFFLCFLSIIMAFGFFKNILNIFLQYGFERAYCGVDNGPIDDAVYFWTNVFWLTKYYEFLDTIFIILEKKIPIFLHLWHHSWVVLVPFVAVRHSLFMGWITAFNNSSVHIIMYAYYGMRSLGYDVWWRKYLTQIQIFQFVFDNLSSLFFLYYKLTGVECYGTWQSWLLGNSIGFSFFLLFMQFYREQYRQRIAASKLADSKSAAAGSKAADDALATAAAATHTAAAGGSTPRRSARNTRKDE